MSTCVWPAFMSTCFLVLFYGLILGKVLSVLLTARELVDPLFLDAVNSLLVSGEYAHIFSNDELDGLLQVTVLT